MTKSIWRTPMLFLLLLLFGSVGSAGLYELRPSQSTYLFDGAHIFNGIEDSTNRFLESIREEDGIEMIIVTLPSRPAKQRPEWIAARIFSRWKIGAKASGKGILLLFIDREKEVKMEVSYELESVFTDGFCGYITDMQLKRYYLDGNIGMGLLAVLEEIHGRATLKARSILEKNRITLLDRELLSGGAGAKRDLTKYRTEKFNKVVPDYSAGKTPEEAWKKFYRSWQEHVRDSNLGIYTECGKLAFRSSNKWTDSLLDKSAARYRGIPYKIYQDKNYAVVYFGEKNQERPPFLFCRTPEGWKFDLVYQRLLVHQDPSNNFTIEYTDHPYINIFRELPCEYYLMLDFPLSSAERYSISIDKALAEQIVQSQTQYSIDQNKFANALNLGRLYTITSMDPKGIYLLKKAAKISPANPLPHKYLAISYMVYFFEFKSAESEIKSYIKKQPDDAFGPNFLGNLYFILGKFGPAIRMLKLSQQIEPGHRYAACKLTEIYGELSMNNYPYNFFGLLKWYYRNKAEYMLEQAEKAAGKSDWRIQWIKDYYELGS